MKGLQKRIFCLFIFISTTILADKHTQMLRQKQKGAHDLYGSYAEGLRAAQKILRDPTCRKDANCISVTSQAIETWERVSSYVRMEIDTIESELKKISGTLRDIEIYKSRNEKKRRARKAKKKRAAGAAGSVGSAGARKAVEIKKK